MTIPHRSLTIRLPQDVYLEVARMAQGDDQNLNTKLNQLVLLGLDKHVSLDTALRRLLLTTSMEAS